MSRGKKSERSDSASASSLKRLPVLISLGVPGGGQFAQKRFLWGIFFQVALTLFFLTLVIRAIFNLVFAFRLLAAGGKPTFGMLFAGLGWPLLGLLLLYIWNLVDAWWAGRGNDGIPKYPNT
jgi:hypothetical protein